MSELFKLSQRILKCLFEPERRRMDGIVQKLTDANSRHYGRETFGFMFDGNFYVPKGNGTAATADKVKLSLATHLIPEAIQFRNEQKALDLDEHRIGQMLFKLTQPCTTMQELRDALPECLLQFIPELKPYERRFNEQWSIMTDARAMEQYRKILPTIEAYTVSHLLY